MRNQSKRPLPINKGRPIASSLKTPTRFNQNRDPKPAPNKKPNKQDRNPTKVVPNRNRSRNRQPYGAVGSYPGIDPKRARGIVQGQLQELLRGLRNEKQGVQQDNLSGIRDINTLHDNTQSGLDFINQQVQAYMAAQQGAMAQNYANTSTAVKNQDTALQGQLQNTNTEHQAAAMAELQRLGIQQTGILPSWDANNAAQMQAAQQMAANNQTNLATQAQGTADISSLMGSLAQGTFGALKGQASIDRQGAINELGDDSRSALQDIMFEMRNARKGKGDAINELLEQMLAGDYDRWANTKDMSFQHMDANRSFAAQQQAMRLGMLQDAANAQTGSSAWQQAYTGNPFPGMNNLGPGSPVGPSQYGPFKSPTPKKKRKGTTVQLGKNRDVYNGPLW